MLRSTLLLAALLATAAPAAADPGQGPVPGPATPPETVRRLPATADGWLLTGELDSIDWPIHLDAATAAQGGTLVLGLESAVSVMPEASTLSVSVNGRTVAQTGLGGPAAGPVAVTVPPATLSAGWNTVRVTASQRHRVDCTLPGTYELWTRIDPAASGFRVASTGAPADLAALARLPVGDDGRLQLRIRTADRSPDRLAQGFAIAGAVARLAGTAHPAVDVAAEPGKGAGLDVAIGTPDQLAGLGIDPIVAAAAVSDPRLVSGADGRPTLVVAEGAVGGVQRLLDRLEDLRVDGGAARGPVRVGGDAPAAVSLAGFGERSEQFTGRLWSRTVHLALPADALTADYDSVVISLDVGYAPDLSPDNRLAVFVGDRLAATVPFGNPRGEVTEDRRVEVPLSLFQPGVNDIRFEAAVASPEDAVCDPRQQISGAPRFLILDSTTITVPRLARMARLPDLAGTLADGRSGAAPGEPLRLALAADDPATASAAATLYARLAVSAADLPKPEILPAGARSLPPGTVLVGAAKDLPAGSLDLVGLARPGPDHPWSQQTAAIPAVATPPLVTGALASDQAPLLDAWRSRVGESDGVLTGLRRRIADGFSSLAGLAGIGDAAPETAIPPVAALVVAQALVPDADAPVTVITAASAETLKAGVERLAAPAVWSRLSGRVAVLDGDADTLTATPAEETRFVATGDLDAGNLRLVLAAWFSTNTGVYGLLLLAASALFGLTTYAKVRRSGVRRP
jgi:hypothetical protein